MISVALLLTNGMAFAMQPPSQPSPAVTAEKATEEAPKPPQRVVAVAKEAEPVPEPVKAPEPVVVPKPAPVVAAPASGSCEDWMVQAGVTDMVNARELIRRESNCNPNAVNPSSGACGIPQALPCSKLGTSDPVAQIRWMQVYVDQRYGGWAGAIRWHNSHNWY